MAQVPRDYQNIATTKYSITRRWKGVFANDDWASQTMIRDERHNQRKRPNTPKNIAGCTLYRCCTVLPMLVGSASPKLHVKNRASRNTYRHDKHSICALVADSPGVVEHTNGLPSDKWTRNTDTQASEQQKILLRLPALASALAGCKSPVHIRNPSQRLFQKPTSALIVQLSQYESSNRWSAMVLLPNSCCLGTA